MWQKHLLFQCHFGSELEERARPRHCAKQAATKGRSCVNDRAVGRKCVNAALGGECRFQTDERWFGKIFGGANRDHGEILLKMRREDRQFLTSGSSRERSTQLASKHF